MAVLLAVVLSKALAAQQGRFQLLQKYVLASKPTTTCRLIIIVQACTKEQRWKYVGRCGSRLERRGRRKG